MKNYLFPLITLIFSIIFFLYTDNIFATSNSDGSPCNRNCGSISDCEVGNDYFRCGWSECDFVGEECAVYGTFCCIGD